MWDSIERIDSSEGNVCKFVYKKEDAVAESVLYRYPDYETRTVICCSTQSGCPVGCRFCGAGDYFVRSLTSDEIVNQVDYSIAQTDVPPEDMGRLQVMFMSMGEPLLNLKELVPALYRLYEKYPNAALLISTIGPRIDYNPLLKVCEEIPTIGLQFSVHKAFDEQRNELIPLNGKLTLSQIALAGQQFWNRTGRKPFFNYCADDDNSSTKDADALAEIFHPAMWECTVSVICERNEGLPARNDHQVELAQHFSVLMIERGFGVRVFDPAGQDDIGGGCGQLWFVQQWMKDNPDLAKPSVGNGLPSVHVPAAA